MLQAITEAFSVCGNRWALHDFYIVRADGYSAGIVQVDWRDNLLRDTLRSPVELHVGLFLVLLVLDPYICVGAHD